jgi:hypothetical protein
MSGKQPFHEDYINPKADPLHSQTIGFDYAAVEQALDEAQEEQPTDGYQALAALIRKMFLWGTDVDLKKKNAQAIIGRRFIALAWVIDPGLFNGSPSASTIARTLGFHPVTLQKLTGEAARHFKIVNRAQDHAWNRGKVAAQQPTVAVNSHDSIQAAEPTPNAATGQAARKKHFKESFWPAHTHGGSKRDRTSPTQRQNVSVP